ncbi:gamma-glutamyl-gamma-aminobutyrate hydrolase family protein [Bacillus sp. RG28]|uniref:Gamma-glutamyl-gamma-aminobutyrate hydrolase family protein n=1 Tax=Gottfriedia endophytica TaxID=2820819 RepID=A0A940SJT7_9BACI|nr:gamma-glutamyl-gamma-aminobutyrate hydrolase family protein [Gottfriedia endophytica]MBP0725254.1 gamma-glutamyl-gamma-aminobutyrate hydrolase family protein [Gottfriedia endophytica]
MKKPIIGITTSYLKHNDNMEGVYVHQDYHRAIERAGGIPVMLPVVNDEEAIQRYVSMCDGIIFSGGEDVDPQFYGNDPHMSIGFFRTERDEFEINLFNEYIKTLKPIFGICRGLQLINVACGGTLIQDLALHKQEGHTVHRHEQTIPRAMPFHGVCVELESRLHLITEKTRLRVNSLHHQAIDKLGGNLVVTSRANDGVIEAIEGTEHPYLVAVQWHPESMSETYKEMQALFDHFIKISTIV